MIDPLTALGAGSGAGALIGVIANIIQGRSDERIKIEEIRAKERAMLSDKITSYQQMLVTGNNGKPYHPPFRFIIMLIASTYCFCTAVCFIAGDIPVATQSFTGEPSVLSFAFGLFKRTSPDQSVYILTFAGLGTYFLSPLAFILTSVLTGITPKRSRI